MPSTPRAYSSWDAIDPPDREFNKGESSHGEYPGARGFNEEG